MAVPCAAALRRAAEAAYDQVLEDFPGTRVVVMGHSIGTGPACHIACVRPVEALILVSPFVTIGRIAGDSLHWSLYYLCPAFFDNIGAMPTLRAPVLFIHGLRDRLCSAATRSAYRKCHYVATAGHDDLSLEQDVCTPVAVFLDITHPVV